jgi:hypothetical protein
MNFKHLNPLLSAMTLALLLVALPLGTTPPPRPGPPGQQLREQPPGQNTAERGNWQGWRRQRGNEGPIGPLVGPVGRFLTETAMEMNRLAEHQETLEKRAEGLDADPPLPPKSRERLQRIIELRRELRQLEKEDFLDRLRTGIENALEAIERNRPTAEMEAPVKERVERVERLLTTLREHSTDFDAVREHFLQAHEAMKRLGAPPPDREDQRLERLAREIELLRHRMGRLQEELQSLSQEDQGPNDRE